MVITGCKEKTSQKVINSDSTISRVDSMSMIHAQEQSEKTVYQYDTLLKNGYYISYKATDSLQYLYLKKKDSIITEVSSIESGLLPKNLGYVVADYGDCFLLIHSYGSGNPHYFELLEKSKGKKILEGTYIDTDEEKQVLLYDITDSLTNNKLVLYNIQNNKKSIYDYPTDITCKAGIEDCVKLVKITDDELIINYSNSKGESEQSYER